MEVKIAYDFFVFPVVCVCVCVCARAVLCARTYILLGPVLLLLHFDAEFSGVTHCHYFVSQA